MKLRQFLIPARLSLLLLLLASSQVLAFSGYYYVIPSSIALRECAVNNCAALLTVYQGEKVEILERTGTGWSRVRLAERAAIGWIPSNFLSYSPDLTAAAAPPYHVKISSVALRDEPRPNGKVLITLQLNDPVEMLGVSRGWAQVRDLRSSTVGWVDPRYISAAPASSPKSSKRRRAPARQTPPKEEKKAPEEAPAPPSAM
jgi:uncharacterized protein YgiM (DUF1202 family)